MNNTCVKSESLENSSEISLEKKLDNNIEGFDFLRAIFSIIIVALKTNLFLLADILFSGTLAYALMAKVGYIAVPVFLQISLFLFYLKIEKKNFLYFLQKRLPRLISLYIFWVGSKVLFDIFVRGKSERFARIISSPRSLIEFIISGSQSPFFFFFSLIFLTTIATIIITLLKKTEKKSKLIISYGLLFVSCLLTFSLSVTEIVVDAVTDDAKIGIVNSISSIAFWDYNPICFLPYLFTTFIVIQEFKEGKLNSWSSYVNLKLCVLLSLFIFFTILEWHLFEELLHYSRLSLVFCSWLLLYVALLSPLRAHPAIKFISSCSLGIYGFHVFFTSVILPFIDKKSFSHNLLLIPGLELIIEFGLVLFCSIVLTLMFKKIKALKNYV